ncbi:MAG: hypothetical protein IJZ08_06605 [Clostridia bacterium]|nr:hypothetical protein [Clostridia bacterium]
MTREQRTELMKRTKVKSRASQETREIRGTYWGAAAMLLLYLIVVCVVKSYGFPVIAAGIVIALLGAAGIEIALRMNF